MSLSLSHWYPGSDISLLWAHKAFTLVCTHSHNNRRYCLVWGKQNEEYHAKCIQATVKSPVSVQVCEAISSRCTSLQRKVNGNMDSAKYLSIIIHDIEILCECVLFPHKGQIFIHDIPPCHNSKNTRTFQEYKGIPVLE